MNGETERQAVHGQYHLPVVTHNAANCAYEKCTWIKKTIGNIPKMPVTVTYFSSFFYGCISLMLIWSGSLEHNWCIQVHWVIKRAKSGLNNLPGIRISVQQNNNRSHLERKACTVMIRLQPTTPKTVQRSPLLPDLSEGKGASWRSMGLGHQIKARPPVPAHPQISSFRPHLAYSTSALSTYNQDKKQNGSTWNGVKLSKWQWRHLHYSYEA